MAFRVSNVAEEPSPERRRRTSRTLPTRRMPCYDEDETDGLLFVDQLQLARVLFGMPPRSLESRSADSADEQLARCAQLRAMRDSFSEEAIAAWQGRTPSPPLSLSLLTPPPSSPIAEPRRIDTYAALAALEGRLVCGGSFQGQTPPKQHSEAQIVDRRVTPEPPAATACPRPPSQLHSRPQPRPRRRPRACPRYPPQTRPLGIYVDTTGGNYEVPVVIHQFPVVVHEVPVKLTPESGIPHDRPPKPTFMREPVKKFFKKALARFSRK